MCVLLISLKTTSPGFLHASVHHNALIPARFLLSNIIFECVCLMRVCVLLRRATSRPVWNIRGCITLCYCQQCYQMVGWLIPPQVNDCEQLSLIEIKKWCNMVSKYANEYVYAWGRRTSMWQKQNKRMRVNDRWTVLNKWWEVLILWQAATACRKCCSHCVQTPWTSFMLSIVPPGFRFWCGNELRHFSPFCSIQHESLSLCNKMMVCQNVK